MNILQRVISQMQRTARTKVRIEFKLQDMWVGCYWDTDLVRDGGTWKWYRHTDVWICLLPMLPLHFKTITPVITTNHS